MAKTVDPIDKIFRLHSRINESFSRAFMNYRRPHSHISQSYRGVEVEIKLPEMNKSDIDLQINPRAVIIKAEKKTKKSKKTKTSFYKSKEINTYYRKIPISPGLDVKKSKARFSNGTLKIRIPKKR